MSATFTGHNGASADSPSKSAGATSTNDIFAAAQALDTSMVDTDYLLYSTSPTGDSSSASPMAAAPTLPETAQPISSVEDPWAMYSSVQEAIQATDESSTAGSFIRPIEVVSVAGLKTDPGLEDPSHKEKRRRKRRKVRMAASAVGGAVAGGAMFGPLGIAAGAVSGAITARSMSKARERKKDRRVDKKVGLLQAQM
jgi:hypothetical protein